MDRFRNISPHIKGTTIAILIIIFFSLLYSSISLWDPDFWWHINTGKYIVEHKKLPEEDIFSFITEGKDSIRNLVILKGYWLAQVVFYEVWKTGGISGIIIFRTIILTLTLCLIWWFMKGGNPYLVLAALLLIGNTLFYFTGERPQTLVFPLTVLMFIMIQGYLEKNGRSFFFLPIITLIWTNLHGSVLFATTIIVIYLISFAMFSKDLNGGKKVSFIIVCLLSVITIFISPLKEYIITEFISFQKSIIKSESIEFFSPFKLFISYGKFYPSYWTCLLTATAILFMNLRRVPLYITLILIATSVLSLTGARYMVFYALSTPLLFRLPQIRVKKSIQIAIVVLALVSVLLNLGYFKPFNFSIRDTYPIRSVNILRDKNPQRIFAYLEWGGFVGYHLPKTKVFIDGRMLNEETLMQYEVVLRGTEAMGQKEWKWNLERHGVDTVVLPLRDFNTERPIELIDRLSKDRDWEMIFYNEKEVVFVRKYLP
jgi:hypothetical protein